VPTFLIFPGRGYSMLFTLPIGRRFQKGIKTGVFIICGNSETIIEVYLEICFQKTNCNCKFVFCSLFEN
jgi:hypothetical protein